MKGILLWITITLIRASNAQFKAALTTMTLKTTAHLKVLRSVLTKQTRQWSSVLIVKALKRKAVVKFLEAVYAASIYFFRTCKSRNLLNTNITSIYGGVILFEFLNFLADDLFLFILHICRNGTFPRPLSQKEEHEYLKRYKECGDIEARNKLVEHNLRLVAHIIKKYYLTQSDQDDLVSIGTIGLIKAINTFDMDKNIKLSSYASRCIENEILMHFRNIKKSAQDISLSETIDIDKDGNPLTLMDIMTEDDEQLLNIDIKINSEKLSEYIESALSDREKKIIIFRYGLNGKDPLTQREVATLLNISRSYVYNIG